MIKIKIYDRLKQESKKSKLKRNRLSFKLVSLLTSSAIVVLNVTGCENKNEVDYSNDNIYSIDFSISDYYHEDSNRYADIDVSSLFNETEKEILNTNVKFDDSSITIFNNDISNHSIDYKYSELYNINEAYQKYVNMDRSYKSTINTNLISNNVVSDEYLFYLVKSNNLHFLQQDMVTMYYELDDEIIYLVCKIIAETITEELNRSTVDFDIGNICENLENLKVLDGAAFSNAFITDDDILVLNIANINLTGTLNDNENQFEMTISHEAEHIIQKASLKKLEYEKVNREHGYCVEFNDIDINSLYWTWLIEGSAENLAVNLYNCEPSTYRNKISYINSLKLSQITNNDFNLYDIEYLTEQENLDEVFKKFDLETDDEKIEFIHMMYSLEIMHQSPDDFIKIYEDKYLNGNSMTDEQKDVINYELKSGICSTMSKYFYKNIIKSMTKKEYKLNEIYELLSLFEQDLNSHLNYDMEEKIEYNRAFFENYIIMQNSFFSILSNKTGIDKDYLRELYIRYNSELSKSQEYGTINAFNNNCLDEEKKLFLAKLRFNKSENQTSTVIENYENLLNKAAETVYYM